MLYRRVATSDILPCKFGCCWPNGRGVGVRVGAGGGGGGGGGGYIQVLNNPQIGCIQC